MCTPGWSGWRRVLHRRPKPGNGSLSGALANIERAFEFLREESWPPPLRSVAIRTAVDILATHPLIGRRIELDLRELVISYGESGYIAVYRFLVTSDEVRVLAIRHQREIGFIP
jgi:plasmid stabilization system protein ParE